MSTARIAAHDAAPNAIERFYVIGDTRIQACSTFRAGDGIAIGRSPAPAIAISQCFYALNTFHVNHFATGRTGDGNEKRWPTPTAERTTR